MVRTFWRVAVVILAVQERPGRISSGGLSSATTTLKSLASWLEMALCEAARPVERRMAVLPISVTWPLKVLLGMASMVMSAGWSELHVDDVGLIHFDFGGDQRHVRDGHDDAAGGF